MSGDGWPEWRNLVLSKLDDHGAEIKAVREDTAKIKLDVNGLKIRVAARAALIGAIPAALAALAVFIYRVL